MGAGDETWGGWLMVGSQPTYHIPSPLRSRYLAVDETTCLLIRGRTLGLVRKYLYKSVESFTRFWEGMPLHNMCCITYRHTYITYIQLHDNPRNIQLPDPHSLMYSFIFHIQIPQISQSTGFSIHILIPQFPYPIPQSHVTHSPFHNPM